MAKISISRALVQKKMLQNQIEKLIETARFTGVKYKKMNKIDGMEVDVFSKESKSSFDKIKDKLNQVNKISAEIAISNAKTMVVVNGEEMTVASALAMKNYINLRKAFLSKLASQYDMSLRRVDNHNNKVSIDANDRFQDYICSAGNVANNSDKAFKENFVSDYKANNEIEIVDPLNALKEIESMKNYLDGFEGDVDIALSESNAKTEIEIDIN